MCENRENIFTQFANKINKFAEHKITKEALYNSFVSMVEMSDENERNERGKYLEQVEKLGKKLVSAKDLPYSNWREGRNMIQ